MSKIRYLLLSVLIFAPYLTEALWQRSSGESASNTQQCADLGMLDATAGSRLGLSIAKELIEMHGGNITAESEPGKGTTFTMKLPRKSS